MCVLVQVAKTTTVSGNKFSCSFNKSLGLDISSTNSTWFKTIQIAYFSDVN